MEAKTRKSAHRALALVLALMLCLTLLIGSAPSSGAAGSGDEASDLYFSQYIEGKSNNKALEIYNGTGAEVDLTAYTVELHANGNTNANNTLNLTGTLADGEVLVLYHSNASSTLKSVAGTNSLSATVCNFNGDKCDYIVLLKNGTEIDVIGSKTEQSPNHADHNLIRKATVTGPATTYNEDEWEFISISSDTSDAYANLGEPTSGGSTAPGTVAAPQASPQAGAVVSGTEITLTCATSGASIYYTLDGTDPTTSSKLYNDNNKPTITANCTLKAVAIKDSVSSAVQTVKYTIKAESEAPIADGDRVVIYNPANKKVMSSETKSDYYRVAENMEITESTDLTAIDDALIWDVSVDSDGNYTFSNNGNKLSAGTHSSLPLNDQNDTWKIVEATTNGCYYIVNVGRPSFYVEYYSQYEEFSLYNYNAGNEGIYSMQFFVVDGEGGDTPEPEPDAATLTENISEGDIVLIYYPNGNKVMSTESYTYTNSSSGKSKDELVALNSTPDNGTISNVPDNTALFKVYKQDGHYVFKSDTGYLYLDGTHVRLVEDLGEHTYFDLESAANGWFIKSTNAQFSGKPQYLEFYGGYFTCFGMGSDTSIYTFQFYKAGNFDPNEEPLPGGGGDEMPISQGDEIGIYLPGGSVVITTTASGNRLSGASATLEDGILTTEADDAVFIVDGNNTDGFTFATADGKYLTTSTTGNTLSMADTAGEYSLWILEQNDEDGWFIKSKNAAYNGNAQYIEYFNSSFTTYSKYNDSDKSIYSFQFYPVTAGGEEPDDKPEGLEVRAAPVSGASVESGDTIELTTMEGAAIYYTTDGKEPTKDSKLYSGELTVGSAQVPEPTSGKPLVIKAIAVLPADVSTGTEEQIGEVYTFTYTSPVSLDGYQLYFGQLHSHTNISDGAGNVTEAFEHAANEVDNLDFLAVTDHSNSFDNESDESVDLGADLSGVSSEWKQGHDAAAAVTDDDFVGIYGFEMTWSDGFGHINTFNTPGFESRSNSEFGNKSGGTEGYQNYYDKLKEVTQSLSQFNHPGTTFGDFQDFAFYDPVIDQRITLIEVGNGEGRYRFERLLPQLRVLHTCAGQGLACCTDEQPG